LQRLWLNIPRDIQAELLVVKAKDDRKQALQTVDSNGNREAEAA
jgi:hypothetical protein